MPSVFRIALPELLHTLSAGGGIRCARIDALFALMANISDTNLYHRGGSRGAMLVREHARAFLRSGGTADPAWEVRAIDCHRIFVAARLSPGGAADLLAGACLVHDAIG